MTRAYATRVVQRRARRRKMLIPTVSAGLDTFIVWLTSAATAAYAIEHNTGVGGFAELGMAVLVAQFAEVIYALLLALVAWFTTDVE